MSDTYTYKQTDSIDTLTLEQLDLMARTQHDILLRYLEKSIIFDVHRIRLMLELGAAEAARRLEALRSNAQAHQTPERSVGGMVPPVVGNSGSEEMR